MTETLNLPPDFQDFLQRGAVLDFRGERCRLGEIQWHSLPELTAEGFLVQSHGTALKESDPNKDQGGGYLVPAVSLLAETTEYPSSFLFCWLPTENCFASGDEEHGHLWVFPGVSWSQIEQDPLPYLEAQWAQGSGVGQLLVPWPEYAYVSYEEGQDSYE